MAMKPRGHRQGDRPILIVGGSGQIGAALCRAWTGVGQRAIGTYYERATGDCVQLDAANRDRVFEVIRAMEPRIIINSLNAKGGTDACELNPELAVQAHFETARNLADAATEVDARFVQISTDYVFDGHAGPYDESAEPRPLSQLGRAKRDAERYALRVAHALVVRTSFVFSWTPWSQTKNFVMQLFDADRSHRSMRVPVDQVGNVTYAPNFADALVELLERRATGVYHVAGTTRCSKHAWALRVATRFALDVRLFEGVTTAQLGQAGPRPLSSGFILKNAQAALARTRLLSLDESLEAMAAVMSRELSGMAA